MGKPLLHLFTNFPFLLTMKEIPRTDHSVNNMMRHAAFCFLIKMLD